MHIKTGDFYKDIADDVEEGFDQSNYEVNRPVLTGKYKKVIGLMKDELGGKIMKKCVIKRRLKFNDYKDCLLNNEIVLKSQQRFKSERHDVYTEEINQVALSSNDDKRLKTFDRITSYPYGTSAGKIYKAELSSKVK